MAKAKQSDEWDRWSLHLADFRNANKAPNERPTSATEIHPFKTKTGKSGSNTIKKLQALANPNFKGR